MLYYWLFFPLEGNSLYDSRVFQKTVVGGTPILMRAASSVFIVGLLVLCIHGFVQYLPELARLRLSRDMFFFEATFSVILGIGCVSFIHMLQRRTAEAILLSPVSTQTYSEALWAFLRDQFILKQDLVRLAFFSFTLAIVARTLVEVVFGFFGDGPPLLLLFHVLLIYVQMLALMQFTFFASIAVTLRSKDLTRALLHTSLLLMTVLVLLAAFKWAYLAVPVELSPAELVTILPIEMDGIIWTRQALITFFFDIVATLCLIGLGVRARALSFAAPR